MGNKCIYFCFILLASISQLQAHNPAGLAVDSAGRTNVVDSKNSPGVIVVRKNGKDPIAPGFVMDTLIMNTPSFQKYMQQLYKVITRTLIYPAKAKENDIEGVVQVSFIVNETGRLTNIKVEQGFDPSCDKEALRALSDIDLGFPIKYNGKAVPVKVNWAINFRLQ